MRRADVLAFLAQRRREEIVVTTMSTFLEWPQYSSHPWDLADGDAMGQATPVGLGLALAQPRKQVWVLNGDGSQLMSLGSLVTVGGIAPTNLVIFIFRNDCYEVTGRQPIPAVDRLDFSNIARGCGIREVWVFDNFAAFREQFDNIVAGNGPVLVDLKIDAP